MEFNHWINSLRESLQTENAPLQLNNGIWKVLNREQLLYTSSSRIFDAHLETFKECAIEVLSEIDPQFELEPDQRYTSGINGMGLKYSPSLRQGFAETLALIGNVANFENCSDNKAKHIVILVIRELFDEPNWLTWGSLNDLLPVLAEAAPNEFLSVVEKSFTETPCPFDELFAQEDSGIFGGNHMTGLLWALEGLAWHEDYIVRVALILADLASHDPGGRWANRPGNSLKTILMPWLPQTFASIEKRTACIKSIKNDFPEVTWDILISLLPNQHQTSSGSHKPKWFMEVESDWKPEISRKEYWEQTKEYAQFTVELAVSDFNKLSQLVENLDNLPLEHFDAVLDYMLSESVTTLEENERFPLWENLTRFAAKHRRFSDAKWALDEKFVIKIQSVADVLSPKDPKLLYRRLFSDHETELFEKTDNFEKERIRLDEMRQEALQTIFETSDMNELLTFSETVDWPPHIGWALAGFTDSNTDQYLIPNYLSSDVISYQQVLDFYFRRRFSLEGWNWVNGFDISNWDLSQRCKFLCYLPFEEQTWKYVSKWLTDDSYCYWEQVIVNPYISDSDLLPAVDSLLDVSRANDALECLYSRLHKKLPIDIDRSVRALLMAVSEDKSNRSIHSHYISEIITALQKSSDISDEDLFKVEWAYLPLLDRYGKAEPKHLESKLASDPGFFCEVIRLIYRSNNEETSDNNDESREAIASNAWRLLHDWKTPPGLDADGSFSASNFQTWLEEVKKVSTETGHLEVSLLTAGEVFLYYPEDSSGLWIVKEVAEVINAPDAQEIRNGFRTSIYNSRGAHWVDPTGQPEKDLALEWRRKANAIENIGFSRFATTLKELADSYNRDAERIVQDRGLEDEQ